MKALLSLVSLAFVSVTAKGECTPLKYEGLQEIARKEGPKHLVFFSSWCADCKVHLKAKLPPNTILIAAFDKPERANATIAKFGITFPCFMDDGIAKKLGVKVVPAEVELAPMNVHSRRF